MRMLAAATAAFALALPWTGPHTHRAADDVIARVADSQGLAFFRPLARERWTPLDARSTLVPGDSLRTSSRGANAVQLRLGGGLELTAGPGVLLRFTDKSTLEVLRGDVAISNQGKQASKLRLSGPDRSGFAAPAAGETLRVRSDGRKLSKLERDPAWLRGYRSSATSEWLGSLVANVDGRDVALTIGSIKITVEIRDQIARTTIEEAFENNTKSTLEGVFRFPLPADASISGFGMWIGDELVEADIVEKQKARRIYEQILRERRDPGLLEWDGGNMFKARVFPIFPHSKKRVRIRYTQVLPLEGRTVRYRYPLRSEMLAKFPLDELVIDAKIWSSDNVASISSPTHAIQASTDGTTASARFEAKDFSPQQDFELRAQLAKAASLRMVPHVRDGDGYFMALVNAPDADSGAWTRTLTPDGKPIDVVLVADVSGSMDASARAAQRSFVEATLSLLGKDDRFHLLTSDADVHSYKDDFEAAGEGEIARAIDWLDARESLGWTDLDATFTRIHKLVEDKPALVVYVGDGVDTAGDGDAAALAQRIRARGGQSKASFHVAYPSAKYEASVVEAIASIGNGSMRRIEAAAPANSAAAMLREARSSALEDLEIEFEGLRTARIYPGELARLPRGMQHTVLGRFLPSSDARKGKVRIRGTLDGKRVEFEREVVVPARSAQDREQSFVPRLWARKHVDALLAEGSKSSSQRDKIVAFSEEFGIMTPFTSFLVLESDADRERFGVDRRVRMRDGEDFFAAARDRANESLLKQQLEKVRGWRRTLQRDMYRELADLGRALHVAIGAVTPPVPAGGGRFGGRIRGGGGGSFGRGRRSELYSLGVNESVRFAAAPAGEADGDMSGVDAATKSIAGERLLREEEKSGFADSADEILEDSELEEVAADLKMPYGPSTPGPMREYSKKVSYDRVARYVPASAKPTTVARFRQQRKAFGPQTRSRPAPPKLSSLGFPHLDAPAKAAKAFESLLPPEIRTVLRGLDRRASVFRADSDRAMRITMLVQQIHAKRQVLTTAQSSTAIVAPDAWLVRTGSGRDEQYEQWLQDGTRGALRRGAMLGRRRAAGEHDLQNIPLYLPDMSFASWDRMYRRYQGDITAKNGKRLTIELTAQTAARGAKNFERIVVDAARSRLLERATIRDGKVVSRTTFRDFVQAAGAEWATRIETRDDKNRVITRHAMDIQEVDAATAKAEMRTARDADGSAIYAKASDPALTVAKNAFAERKASALEILLLLAYRSSKQQWKEGDKLLEAADKALSAAQKRDALSWIRASFLRDARRAAPLQEVVDSLAARAKDREGELRHWHAASVFSIASSRYSAQERLTLLEALRSTITKPATNGKSIALYWGTIEAQLIRQAQGIEAHGKAIEKLQAEHPWALTVVQSYGRSLVALDRQDEARAFWRTQCEREGWTRGERETLLQNRSDFLWQMRHFGELRSMLAAWTLANPESQNAWHRWLGTEMFADQVASSDAWVTDVMRTLPETLDAQARAKLFTCVQHAFGNGWQYNSNRLTPQWSGKLLELSYALLERQETTLLRTITGQWYGRRNNDVVTKLRARIREDLLRDGRIAELALDALEYRLDSLRLGKGVLAADAWRKVMTALELRWKASVEAGNARRNEEARLAWRILRHCHGQGEKAAALAFARKRLEGAPAAMRRTCAQELWTRSLQLDDVVAVQCACVELFEPIATSKDEQESLGYAGDAVRAASKRLYALLYKRSLGEEAARKKLSRAALRELQKTARRDAALALSSWLREIQLPASFRPWLALEAAGYEARRSGKAGEKLSELRAAVSAAKRVYAEAAPDPKNSAALKLRVRAAMLAAYAGARREADGALRSEVLAWLETLPQAEPGSKSEEGKVDDLDGRYHLARFLLACDRVEELEARLAQWIRPADAASRWRVMAAYLRAERRDIAKAVELFELVQSKDELQASELSLLADWRLVLGNRDGRAGAMRAVAHSMSEWQLRQKLQRESNRVSRRRGSKIVPEISASTFVDLEALLTKSSYPSNQTWIVRNLYRATKDHRILEQLPAGVVGHTQSAVYNYLRRMSRILREVHEEAACDRIDAAITQRLRDTKVDLDRRALQLLRTLVRGRAADVRNAAGPHVRVALKSLRSAIDVKALDEGEPKLLALFLQGATLSGSELKAERLRQLEALVAHAKSGSPSHIAVSLSLASVMHGSDAVRAIDILEDAVRERVRASKGRLPADSYGAWNSLQNWMLTRGSYPRIEKLAMRIVDSTQDVNSRRWLQRKLRSIRLTALRSRGSVSLGSGLALYQALRTRIEAEIVKITRSRVSSSLQDRATLADAAHQAGIKHGARDLIEYANGLLPEIVRSMPRYANYQQVGNTIAKIASRHDALEFAVARHADQPKFWRRIGRDVWSRMGYSISRWRHDARVLGQLDAPLSEIVLAELRDSLVTMRNSHSSMWWQSNRYFWRARRSDYIAVAMEVLRDQGTSPARVAYASNYLWNGVQARKRAVTARFEADAKGMLTERYRRELARWCLHESVRRPDDALRIADLLLAEDEFRLEDRLIRVRALRELGRRDDALAYILATEKLFREQKRLSDSALEKLASAASGASTQAVAARYWAELITRRDKALGGVARPDSKFCWLHVQHANSLIQLKRWPDAFKAARSAIVSAGTNTRRRKEANRALSSLLSKGPLDELIAMHDAEVETSGRDAPVLRKAFGQELLARRKHQQAIAQLRLATELQSNDPKTWQLIVSVYDQAGDRRGALAAFAESMRKLPFDLSRGTDFAKRLESVRPNDAAIRAWTNLVELRPAEANSHRTLARYFERKKAWQKAAKRWQRVVDLRSEEPQGWFHLVDALAASGARNDARNKLRSMLDRPWEKRFGDVKSQVSTRLTRFE